MLGSYLFISLVAFFINIPFGFIREGCRKFSFGWLFWIHASIPLLIYLRIILEVSNAFIPVSIFFAVIGQIIGCRYRRRKMTREEKEKIAKIPDLNIRIKKLVEPDEVMVVLLNMGGPKENSDVTDFQFRLFSDSLLIRFPLSFLLQKPFAKLLVAMRAKASRHRYQLIGGGSPIYRSTAAQVQAVKNELRRRHCDFDVTFSFNYSPPFPIETIREIKGLGKKYILPLSLYPHYSKATTGSNLHYLKQTAQKYYPELIFIDAPSYHLHDGYIQAFVDRIHETLGLQDSLEDFYLVFSAHGLPKYFLWEGDFYPFQISQTVSKILSRLRRERDWVICYQSAVGPFEWLTPSIEDTITALIGRGIKKILIVPVSFVGDHIETICEIDIEYRQLAQRLGIEDFRMSKAIECHPGFIQALVDSVESVTEIKKSEIPSSLARAELSTKN